ncbi:MAG TPA: class I SAM-dependent methyltransferase, partial [Gemmatimonadales bacterium]|nr:class I SAM-dependent methyltransferase [Gemmatimonadales bacterium]
MAASYDAIAESWCAARSGSSAAFRERRFVEGLVAPLSPKARILDLGCGCGEPIGRWLADAGFELVGVDLSQRLLALAARALPHATLVHGDMRTVDLRGPFDAIVAWDSVFHLPRRDHPALFRRLAAWLAAGGRLLLSLGGSDQAGFTSDMHGATFFYSGDAPARALAALGAAGFRIERWEVDDPSGRGH